MRNVCFKKALVVGIIVLFLGVSVLSGVSSKSISNIYKEDIAIQIDKQNEGGFESQGVWCGIIYGKICNLQGSGDRINFYAISVTIIPGFHHLINRDAWIKKPYIGIINTKFILILGTIYSGW